MTGQSAASSAAKTFALREQASQARWLSNNSPIGARGCRTYDFILHKAHAHLNLAPAIQDDAVRYFARPGEEITWHDFAGHARSSQACCLNFLMPLARNKKALAKFVGASLGIAPPAMLEVEKGPDKDPWYVGFEWVGRADYLGEARAGVVQRGANATSADAIVRFESEGLRHTLLIEWKYTEKYGAPISKWNDPQAIATRTGRYQKLAFETGGIIRPELKLSLSDFFWDPFYQLLRQQLLAARMQAAREDGADRVRVLHISPSANFALHRVTSPRLREAKLGEDAFAVFRATLRDPDAFIDTTIEKTFGPLLASGGPEIAEWARYVATRYDFLSALVGAVP